MEKYLKELLDEINYFHQSEDVEYDLFDKIENYLEAGDRIEIFWKDRAFTDTGYIFRLPHQISDEYDLCVHVTEVDNSDGMDSVDDEFHHLYHLVALDRILKIKKL